MNSGHRFLRSVRGDLADIVEVCNARKKQTNYIRSLISDMTKGEPLLCVLLAFLFTLVLWMCTGIIPKSWHRYTVPAGLTVIQWVADFSERIKQLQAVSNSVAESGSKVLKVGSHKFSRNCTLGIGQTGKNLDNID